MPDKTTPTESALSPGSAPVSVAAHWFTAPALTFGLSTWPLPSFRDELPGFPRNTPLLSFASLSKSSSAPGPPPAALLGAGSHRWTPLVRFFSPSALEDWSIHSPQPCPSRYVPPSSFQTTSTACSTPVPPRSFPRGTLMGFLPSRVSPVSARPESLPIRAPLLVFTDSLPLSTGALAMVAASPPGIHSSLSTVVAGFGFPLHRDSYPPGFFFGTSTSNRPNKPTCPIPGPRHES